MAIANTINSMKQHIEDVYGIAEEKQASIPEQKNLENLADCVASISGSEDLDAELNDYEQGLNAEDITLEDIENMLTGRAIDDEPDLVEFYDYDGTLLYSCLVDEMKLKTELPALPEHEGLICQGWNWTLEEIIEEDKPTIVGASYITDDGNTRIYIKLDDEGYLAPYCSFSINGTATIDWGDGSEPSIVTGTGGRVDTKHTYNSIGEYKIAISSDAKITTVAYTSGSNVYSSTLIWGRFTNSNNYMINRAYTNSIKKVELGNNIILGKYSFYACNGMESITIPDNITIGEPPVYVGIRTNFITVPRNIVDFNFSSGNIKTLSLSPNIKTFQPNCFNNPLLEKITIPNSFTTVNNSPFYNCYNLKSISFSKNQTKTFGLSNSGIEKVKIPKNITEIYASGFLNCKSLKEITLPPNITTLGNLCFDQDSSLVRVNGGENLSSLGDMVFRNCSKLKYIEIPETLTTIKSSAFSGCSALIDLELHNNITSIQDFAFQDCTNLKITKLPDNLSYLGRAAFSGCYMLCSSLIIPRGVNTIGDSCFSQCHKIKSVKFLGNITSIYSQAFYSCINVLKYDFTNNIQVPTLASMSSFGNISSDCKIVVPDELYEEWIVANNWNDIANRIVKESEYSE